MENQISQSFSHALELGGGDIFVETHHARQHPGCDQVARGCCGCEAMSLLHLLAHPSRWVTPPARSPSAPRKIWHRSVIGQPNSSLSPGALVIWCKFENPPFSAKMDAKRPLEM
eukprot:1159929-Pelagomonas_calceolata.AAC.3